MTLALLFSLGCSSTSKASKGGEYIDDSRSTKVKAALLGESTCNWPINVETFGCGPVGGFTTQADINKAVEEHAVSG
jgi:hypothetical protein